MQLGGSILSDAYNASSGLTFKSIAVRIIQSDNIEMLQEIVETMPTSLINSKVLTMTQEIGINTSVLTSISQTVTIQV